MCERKKTGYTLVASQNSMKTTESTEINKVSYTVHKAANDLQETTN